MKRNLSITVWFLVSIVAAQLFHSERAYAAWLDPAWSLQVPVTISNPGGSTLSNFQVHLSLDSTFDFANAKVDGSDVRITSDDGTTLIPFWIESWDAVAKTASIWINVPTIPSSGTTVYLYFENPAAASASNGAATFELFDDFEPGGTVSGYYQLGAEQTVMVQDQPWEDSAPHSLSIIENNSGGYAYWGYYGLQAGCGGVGLAYSNDLVNWTKDAGNPLFLNGRWPSVLKVGSDFYMLYTMDFCATSHINLAVSSDGINFSDVKAIVPVEAGVRNQNPNLFYNPNDGKYYIYWYSGDDSSYFEVRARSAATPEGLDDAGSEIVVLQSANLLAAPNMLFKDGTYFLSVESYSSGQWIVQVYSSTSPTSGFSLLPGNPVLGNNSACNFQHVVGTELHDYYCKYTGSTWSIDHRVADLTAGRLQFSGQVPDPDKWTASGGSWTGVIDTQEDGTVGSVLQGSIGSDIRDAIISSYQGGDYVLEAYGKQINGRAWGLGVRGTDQNNLYTVNLYEDLDGTTNLYVYNWVSGSASELANAAVGVVNANTWYKLSVKAYGDSIDVYKDNALMLQTSSSQYGLGAVALYGEQNAVMQFNNILVRKFAAIEPLAIIPPPAVPSGLTATPINPIRIDLDWTSSSPTSTDTFEIQRRDNGCGTGGWTTIATPPYTTVTYQDNGVSPSTTYGYQVRATNTFGSSAWTNCATETTPAIGAPSGLSATVVLPSEIDLAWTDGSIYESGFIVQRKTSNVCDNNGWTTITTLAAGSGTVSYPDTGLIPDRYTYRVGATLGAYTEWSNCATVTIPQLTSPTSLTVSPVSSTNGAISITAANSGPAGITYVFEESKDGGAFAQVYSGPNRFVNLTGRTTGVYTYQVKTTLAGWADSAWMAGANSCTVTLALVAPTSLTVSPVSSTNGAISITAANSGPAGITYVFEESKDGGAFATVYSGPNRFVNLTGRTTGVYTYQVKTTLAGWTDSAWRAGSNACTVTLPAQALALVAPTSLTVSPVSSTNGAISITAANSGPAGITYVFEESKDGGAFAQVYSGPNRFVNLTGRTTGVYTYQVKTTLAGWADSAWMAGANSCTVTLALVAPTSLTVSPVTSTNGAISITAANSGPAGITYVFEESKDGGAFATVYSGPNRFVNLTGRTTGVYTYQVKTTLAGWTDSAWRAGSNACTVTLPAQALALVAPTSLTVSPVSSTNGAISITAANSGPAGITYVFEESKDGGAFAQVYSGPNRFVNLTGRTTGVYTYQVKTTLAGWADSAWMAGANSCTVTLALVAPTSLTVSPVSSTNGAISITAANSGPAGITYVFEESKDGGAFATVYSGPNRFVNLTGRTTGVYTYQVKTTLAGWTDSAWRAGANSCTVP